MYVWEMDVIMVWVNENVKALASVYVCHICVVKHTHTHTHTHTHMHTALASFPGLLPPPCEMRTHTI